MNADDNSDLIVQALGHLLINNPKWATDYRIDRRDGVVASIELKMVIPMHVYRTAEASVRDNNTLSGDVSITGADDQVIDGEFC
jgi:hypothetical protein